jgi:hypothetical protein
VSRPVVLIDNPAGNAMPIKLSRHEQAHWTCAHHQYLGVSGHQFLPVVPIQRNRDDSQRAVLDIRASVLSGPPTLPECVLSRGHASRKCCDWRRRQQRCTCAPRVHSTSDQVERLATGVDIGVSLLSPEHDKRSRRYGKAGWGEVPGAHASGSVARSCDTTSGTFRALH